MREFDVEDSGKGRRRLAEGNASPRDDPASIAATRGDLSEEEPVRLASGREELVEEMRRLETELERYRAHAERTSKLFLSATNYAEWVRESARRDAEVALRKAGARVKELELTASEFEQTKNDIVRQKDELARLQALTEATRSRLSAFLTAGLDALDTHEDGADPAVGDLEGTLRRQLVSAPASSGPLAEDDTQES